LAALLFALLALWPRPSAAETSLLNVSYDPTRRFYAAVNKAFVTRLGWPSTAKTFPSTNRMAPRARRRAP
jgi:ABC-type sulfate transport system substrate-binding protein